MTRTRTDLTPEQRERVEAALSDHAMAFAGLCAMERTAIERAVEVDWLPGIGTARKKAKDTQKALLATVAALVSEAVAAERGRWAAHVPALRAAALGMQAAGLDPLNDVSWRLNALADEFRPGEPSPVTEWREVSRRVTTGGCGTYNQTTDPARPHPHTEEPL